MQIKQKNESLKQPSNLKRCKKFTIIVGSGEIICLFGSLLLKKANLIKLVRYRDGHREGEV